MFQKIDQLLRLLGGRCIIVEDGEPRYVVLPVRDYLTLHEGHANPTDQPAPRDAPEERTLKEANRTIELIRKEGGEVHSQAPEAPASEYRIEDIPF